MLNKFGRELLLGSLVVIGVGFVGMVGTTIKHNKFQSAKNEEIKVLLQEVEDILTKSNVICEEDGEC